MSNHQQHRQPNPSSKGKTEPASSDLGRKGGATLRVRAAVTPTHGHAGSAHAIASLVSGGSADRGAEVGLRLGLWRWLGLRCPLVPAGMPHLENMVLCRESQVSLLQSLFGEVLWSNYLFSSKSWRQTFPWSCDVFSIFCLRVWIEGQYSIFFCIEKRVVVGRPYSSTLSNFWLVPFEGERHRRERPAPQDVGPGRVLLHTPRF